MGEQSPGAPDGLVQDAGSGSALDRGFMPSSNPPHDQGAPEGLGAEATKPRTAAVPRASTSRDRLQKGAGGLSETPGHRETQLAFFHTNY